MRERKDAFFSQPGQRRRVASEYRNPIGSGRAHFALFGPVGREGSSPPAPHTAMKKEGVRAC